MSGAGTPTRTRPAGRSGATAPRAPRGSGPPVDPRIRARRAEISRSQGRRRLRLALLGLVVVGLVVGGWFLLHSRVLSARVVRVEGSVHTPRAEIISVAGLAHDPPLIDVNPGAVAARLETLPWVARATVTRHWPDAVEVSVVERRPAAALSTTSAKTPATSTASPRPAPAEPWALVDRTGRVLALVATPPPGLVHLSGPVHPGGPGSTVPPDALGGLEVAATLPPAFKAQVTTVEVESGGRVHLALTTPVTVDLGTTSQLRQKYEDTAAVLAGGTLVAGDVIDVSVPDSPTVGPA
ncbi:MAG TPA: FtsQ-type POTRA domain-containing protein [Acidimicrobiales bacterium]|nr:FtsQ-type POTRA domain-containing protein [Acidimicrobiales bacterium]